MGRGRGSGGRPGGRGGRSGGGRGGGRGRGRGRQPAPAQQQQPATPSGEALVVELRASPAFYAALQDAGGWCRLPAACLMQCKAVAWLHVGSPHLMPTPCCSSHQPAAPSHDAASPAAWVEGGPGGAPPLGASKLQLGEWATLDPLLRWFRWAAALQGPAPAVATRAALPYFGGCIAVASALLLPCAHLLAGLHEVASPLCWHDSFHLCSKGLAADPQAELAFSQCLTKAQRASVHGCAGGWCVRGARVVPPRAWRRLSCGMRACCTAVHASEAQTGWPGMDVV